MTSFRLAILKAGVAVLAFSSVGPALLAQTLVAEAPTPSFEAASAAAFASVKKSAEEHRFWDKENRILFTAVAATSGADFAVTRANLQSGGRDLNPVVRFFGPSTAGLAVNFAGETAGVIGVSYLLHRTGHHKLERIFSLVNIGSSASAVGYDLAIR
jgi:hypothetical protein